MVDKRYYEKLGGFSYVLDELSRKIGRRQKWNPAAGITGWMFCNAFIKSTASCWAAGN